METKYGDLQIEEDMPFQEWTWKIERVGWVLMALIVLASALGLISEGPIGKTYLGDPSSLQIELHQSIHIDTPTRIHVRLVADGPYSIQFPYSYLSRAQIAKIVPDPDRVESSNGVVTYFFSGTQGRADVHLDLQFRSCGPGRDSSKTRRQRLISPSTCTRRRQIPYGTRDSSRGHLLSSC